MPPKCSRETVWSVRTVGIVLVTGFALACTQPQAAPPERRPAAPTGTDRLKPTYDDTGKLQKLQYDRDGDGKADTWGYMDGSRVVKVEVDTNGDGNVDTWEFHRAGAAAGATTSGAPASVDRTVERIERSTRFDGTVSRREFFENGTLTRTEDDTDGDGRIDKWETYVGGSLSTMALDTQGSGTADRRLVYKADGSLDHIEADPNHTGTFTPVKP